jgi:hypothetical protein
MRVRERDKKRKKFIKMEKDGDTMSDKEREGER